MMNQIFEPFPKTTKPLSTYNQPLLSVPTSISSFGISAPQGQNLPSSSSVSNSSNKYKKLKFSPDEDSKLKSLVSNYGTKSWTIISNELKGRTPRQCRDRWKHYLCPETNLTEWTKEEDSILISHFSSFGNHWAKIASFFPGRTSVSVRNRCCRLLKQINKQQSASPHRLTNESIDILAARMLYNQYQPKTVNQSYQRPIAASVGFAFDQINVVQQPIHDVTNQSFYQNDSSSCIQLMNGPPNRLDLHGQAMINNNLKNVDIEDHFEHKFKQKIHLPPCQALPFPPSNDISVIVHSENVFGITGNQVLPAAISVHT